MSPETGDCFRPAVLTIRLSRKISDSICLDREPSDCIGRCPMALSDILLSQIQTAAYFTKKKIPLSNRKTDRSASSRISRRHGPGHQTDRGGYHVLRGSRRKRSSGQTPCATQDEPRGCVVFSYRQGCTLCHDMRICGKADGVTHSLAGELASCVFGGHDPYGRKRGRAFAPCLFLLILLFLVSELQSAASSGWQERSGLSDFSGLSSGLSMRTA